MILSDFQILNIKYFTAIYKEVMKPALVHDADALSFLSKNSLERTLFLEKHGQLEDTPFGDVLIQEVKNL